MNEKQWIEHIIRRSDITSRVTHLTRRVEDKSGIEVLYKILEDKKLLASDIGGYVRCGAKAVCFQDVPLYSLAENIKYESEIANERYKNSNKIKYRYEAFGLRFNKAALYSKGARPVIYGTSDELDRIPDSEQWRCVRMEFNTPNVIIDWSHEREWRIQGDFDFEYNEVEIIIGCKDSYKKFIQHYKDSSILEEINGIVVLDSMFK